MCKVFVSASRLSIATHSIASVCRYTLFVVAVKMLWGVIFYSNLNAHFFFHFYNSLIGSFFFHSFVIVVAAAGAGAVVGVVDFTAAATIIAITINFVIIVFEHFSHYIHQLCESVGGCACVKSGKRKKIGSCIKIKNEMKEKEQESCDDDDDDGMTKKLIREQGERERASSNSKNVYI